jgi:hypothetical protein
MKKLLQTLLTVAILPRHGRLVTRCYVAVAALFLVVAAVPASAEPGRSGKKRGLHKLSIEPSSASLAGGKARLILTSLVRTSGAYVGDYELKVTPYFFKSEKGKLSLAVSDQALQKLAQSSPADFAGNATTAGSGLSRPTRVKAIPSANDRGMLKISVATENGPMVFNTSYRFAE